MADTFSNFENLGIVRGKINATANEVTSLGNQVNTLAASVANQLNGTTALVALQVDNLNLNGNTISSTTGALALSATGANVITASTNGAERLRITSGGDVGIGTAPAAGIKLAVAAASGTTIADFTNNVDANFQVKTTSGLTTVGSSVSAPLAIQVGNTERLRIDASGNLGIGTASPTATFGDRVLQVAGTASANSEVRLTHTTSGAGSADGLTLLLTGTEGYLYNREAGNLLFGTSNTERMRIDASGNVGIGAAPSSAKLHVSDAGGAGIAVTTTTAGNATILVDTAAGGTAILDLRTVAGLNRIAGGAGGTSNLSFHTASVERMRIDASGNLGLGVTPSAWGSGPKAFQLPNGASFFNDGTQSTYVGQNVYSNAGSKYIATAAASLYAQGSGAHIWFTAPSGTAGSAITFTQAMTLDASGHLLIGPTVSSGTGGVSIRNNSAGTSNMLFNRTTTTASSFPLEFQNAGTAVGNVAYTNTGTAFNTTSDYRLKENVQPMQNALATVAQLNPVTYTWKSSGSDGQGFIAHELQAVVPDCVTGEKDAVDADGNPQYQGVDTSFLVATLVKAIQEQQATITALEARIAALEA